jgi:tRNA-dihydrouridine synthase B
MQRAQPPLTEPFRIGDVEIPNRVLLAPLASIGNWFVRLQATRHGAGMAVSEMVSSMALHYGNERTRDEMLRIHPEEGPVAIQLFGPDPEAMRTAAAAAAEAGASIIDINMGCPVRKVLKTGAGAALIESPENALELARAAIEGSGLPVTVKLRSGLRSGDRSGFDLALRLVGEAGVSAIGFHPRTANVQHKGKPDYALARELVEALRSRGLQAPLIISGGLRSPEKALYAYTESNADAVMIARGALGNPWIFGRLTGREQDVDVDAVVREMLWLIDCGEQHWGERRASRNLRKFYPWYLERLEIKGRDADAFQRTETLDEARELVASIADRTPVEA